MIPYHGEEKRPHEAIMDELNKECLKELGVPLGATGTFAEGDKPITPEDQGQIAIAVGAHEGNVILEFKTPVKWLALPPNGARQLAEVLRKQSYIAQKQK